MAASEILLERDVKDFKFQQLCRVRISNDAKEKPYNCKLVVSCSSYGISFLGDKNGFIVLKTADISQLDQQHSKERMTHIIDDPPAFASVKVPGYVTHLSISCDDLTLAVVVEEENEAYAYVYDVRIFADKLETYSPFLRERLSKGDNSKVEDVQWNPTNPAMVAVVLTSGHLSLYEFKENLHIVAYVSEAKAVSANWSPKGKQIVIGTLEGKLVQYDQELKAKREWPCPPPIACRGTNIVTGVLWLSTYSFLASYLSASAENGDQPDVVMIIGSKEGKTEYINFEDPCYGTGEGRKKRLSFAYLSKWELIVVVSNTSCGVAVIGKHFDNPDRWEIWNLEDSARAELPLSENQDDNYPLGFSIDYSSQFAIPVGESSFHPPSPVLLVYSSDGVLVPYYLMFRHKNALAESLTITPKPFISTGARKGKISVKAPETSVPSSGSGLPTSGPSFQFVPQKTSAAGTGTPTQGLFSFNKSTASPLVTPTPSNESQTAASAPKPFSAATDGGGTPITTLYSGQPISGLFTSSSGNVSAKSNQPSFSFTPVTKASLSFVKENAASTDSNSNQPLFGLSGKSGTPVFSFGQTPQSSASSAPSSAASGGLFGTKGSVFGTPSSASGTPEVKPSFNLASSTAGAGSKTFTPSNVFSPSTSEATSQSKIGSNIFQANIAGNVAPPNVVMGQGKETVGQQMPFGVSQKPNIPSSRVPSNVAPNIMSALGGNNTSLGSIQQAASRLGTMADSLGFPSAPAKNAAPKATAAIPPTTESTANLGSMKTVQPRDNVKVPEQISEATSPSKQKEIVDTFTISMYEEMAHFEKEMSQFRNRYEPKKKLVGTKEEMLLLKNSVETLRNFCEEIKVTTSEQSKEIEDQKMKCLDLFALMEDCRGREKRNYDARYINLLKARALDPASASHMRSLKQQQQALEQGLRDVDAVLDQQWEQFMKKKKSQNRFAGPTSDSIYNALKSNRNIIIKQKSDLDALSNKLKNLHLPRKSYHSSSQLNWNNSTTPLNDPDSELYNLADSLIHSSSQNDIKISEQPSSIRKKSSPVKEAKLREFLSNRSVPRIKSVKPENLSYSRIVAAERSRREKAKEAVNVPNAGSQQRNNVGPSNTVAPAPSPGTVGISNARKQQISKAFWTQQYPQQGQFQQNIPQNAGTRTQMGYAFQGNVGAPDFQVSSMAGQLPPGQTNLGHIVVEDITPPSSACDEDEDDDYDEDDDDYVDDEDEDGEEGHMGFGTQYFMPGTQQGDKTPTNEKKGNLSSTPKASSELSFIAPKAGGASKNLFGTSTPITVSTSKPFDFGAQKPPTMNFGLTAATKEETAPTFKFGDAGGGSNSSFVFSGSDKGVFTFGVKGSKATSQTTSPSQTPVDQVKKSTKVPQAEEATEGSNALLAKNTLLSKALLEDEVEEKPGSVSSSTTNMSKGGGSIASGTPVFSLGKSSEAPSGLFGTPHSTAGLFGSGVGAAVVSAIGSGSGESTFSALLSAVSSPGSPPPSESARPSSTAPASEKTSPSQSLGTKSSDITFGTGDNPSETPEGPDVPSAPPKYTGLFNNSTGGNGLFTFKPSAASENGGVFGMGASFSASKSDSTTNLSKMGVPAAPQTPEDSGEEKAFTGASNIFTAAAASKGTTTTQAADTTVNKSPSSSTPQTTATSQASNGNKTSSSAGIFGTALPTATTSGGLFGTSTATTLGGLFGTSTAKATSGGLFGSSTSTVAPTSTLLVGSNKSAPSSVSQGLFGSKVSANSSTTAGTTGTTTAAGGLFGTQSQTTSSFAFGSGSTTTTAAAATSSSSGLFGGSTASTTTTTTPASSTGGFFGSGSSAGSFSFGATTTTSSSSGGLFGNTATSEGLFGSGAKSPSSCQSTTGFGGASGTPAFGSGSTSTSGGLFGSASTSSTGTGLFGSSTSTPAGFGASTGGLFGSSQTTTASVFGQPPAFGSQPASTSSGPFGSSPSKPLFGTPSTGTAPVFGSSGFGQTPTSGFGSPPAGQASSSVFGGSSFGGLGGQPSAERANTNVFGASQSFGTHTSGSSSLFGSTSGPSFGTSGSQSAGGPFSGGGAGGFGGGGEGVKATGFGVAKSQTATGGFGSPPSFGSAPGGFGSPPAFGSTPAFGSSPGSSGFGTGAAFSNPMGGSTFGSAGGSSGFAGFASSAAPSFGSLAQTSNTPSFGSLSQTEGGGGFGALAQQGSQGGFGSPSQGFGGGGFGNNVGSSPSFTGYRG